MFVLKSDVYTFDETINRLWFKQSIEFQSIELPIEKARRRVYFKILIIICVRMKSLFLPSTRSFSHQKLSQRFILKHFIFVDTKKDRIFFFFLSLRSSDKLIIVISSQVNM